MVTRAKLALHTSDSLKTVDVLTAVKMMLNTSTRKVNAETAMSLVPLAQRMLIHVWNVLTAMNSMTKKMESVFPLKSVVVTVELAAMNVMMRAPVLNVLRTTSNSKMALNLSSVSENVLSATETIPPTTNVTNAK